MIYTALFVCYFPLLYSLGVYNPITDTFCDYLIKCSARIKYYTNRYP